MSVKKMSPWGVFGLLIGIMVLVSLACDLPFQVNFGSTPTPTAAVATIAPVTTVAPSITAQPSEPSPSPAPKTTACLLPNLVGMDQKAAEVALNTLGLSAEKQVEMSIKYPAGTITMQDPAAGARLEPCQGKVSIWVSAGGGASEASATPTQRPSPTEDAGPLPTAGPRLANPAAFETLYAFYFAARPNGFDDVLWDVQPAAGAVVVSKAGKLNVTGRVEAYAAEATYNQLHSKTRILLAGGTYAIGLKEFTLIFNRSKDGKKYLALGCADQAQGASASLVCDLYSGANGQETKLANTHAAMCLGKCDLELELTDTNVLVYANAEQKIAFKNNLSIEGTIGLRIDNPTSTPFAMDAIVIYAAPEAGTSYGTTQYREDFGDEWGTGKLDNEYATINRTLGDWTYHWDLAAKQSMITTSMVYSVVLPNNFRLVVNVKKTSGPADAAYGALFRVQDASNFYYFAVRDEGTVAIYAQEAGKWVELLKRTKVSGIKPGAENELRIEGKSSQYTFFINDKQVASLADTRFKGGSIGLIAELGTPGQKALIDFTGVNVDRLQP